MKISIESTVNTNSLCFSTNPIKQKISDFWFLSKPGFVKEDV